MENFQKNNNRVGTIIRNRRVTGTVYYIMRLGLAFAGLSRADGRRADAGLSRVLAPSGID